MATNIGNLSVSVSAETDKFSSGMAQAKSTLKRFSDDSVIMGGQTGAGYGDLFKNEVLSKFSQMGSAGSKLASVLSGAFAGGITGAVFAGLTAVDWNKARSFIREKLGFEKDLTELDWRGAIKDVDAFVESLKPPLSEADALLKKFDDQVKARFEKGELSTSRYSAALDALNVKLKAIHEEAARKEEESVAAAVAREEKIRQDNVRKMIEQEKKEREAFMEQIASRDAAEREERIQAQKAEAERVRDVLREAERIKAPEPSAPGQFKQLDPALMAVSGARGFALDKPIKQDPAQAKQNQAIIRELTNIGTLLTTGIPIKL